MARRRVPGELSPAPSHRNGHAAAACEFHEQAEKQWWQTEQAAIATGGKSFPGLISREGNERFEKLYADSADRMTKLSRMQDEARQERHETERNFQRPSKKASKDELSYACNRLYNEAENRRQRTAKKKEEQQYLEELQQALCIGSRSSSTPNLSKNGASHWDRLYACGAEKQRKLDLERQRQAESEQKYLEDHSVHANTRAVPASGSQAYNRLYNDSMQRNWRREQKKVLDAAREQNELGEASVHRNIAGIGSEAADIAEETAERLYKEGKSREQRLEMQRKLKAEEDTASMQGVKFQSREESDTHIKRRVDLLYNDAERRNVDRQWMQEEYEKEELESLLRASVHASVRENASAQIDRIFDRVHQRDRPRDMHLANAPRSARVTPQRQRPGTGEVRPSTARQQSAPGNLDAAVAKERQVFGRSVTPRQAPKPKSHSHNRAAAAPKAKGRAKGIPAEAMTNLVEEGARQALSTDLPSF